jgi:FkbM family methyltransferase
LPVRPPNLTDRLTAFLFRRRWRGAISLHSLLHRGQRFPIRTKHGVIILADPFDYVDGCVLRFGYYEEEVLIALLQLLQPGEVFWDVGANLGLHALTVAQRKPGIRTYAFEPNPSLAALLRQTAVLNAAAVGVMEIALAEKTASAEFFLHEGNSGRSGLHNWDSNARVTGIRVTTMTASDVVKSGKAPFPNVLKIDVEGSEHEVLKGMSELLPQRALRAIVFEDARNETPAKQLLQRAGFSLRALSRLEPTHHNLENYVAQRT